MTSDIILRLLELDEESQDAVHTLITLFDEERLISINDIIDIAEEYSSPLKVAAAHSFLLDVRDTLGLEGYEDLFELLRDWEDSAEEYADIY